MIKIHWNLINNFARTYYSLQTKEERDSFIKSKYKLLHTDIERKKFKEELKLLPYAFDLKMREKQNVYQYVRDGKYKTIAIIAGRGFGKTLAASKFIRDLVYNNEIDPKHDMLIVGPTNSECKKILYDGDSGILNIFPQIHRPEYLTQSNKIIFHNQNKAFVRTSENADSCRGSNTGALILDEIAAFNHLQLNDLYNNAIASLRKKPAICLMTSTPKSIGAYGIFFKQLYEESLDPDNKTLIIKGTSLENKDNLVDIEDRYRKYANTLTLKEEYEAEFLFNDFQQLFPESALVRNTYDETDDKFAKVVISIDPATTSNKKSDETGIISAGLILQKDSFEIKTLDDLSGQVTPEIMAQSVIDLWFKYYSKRIPVVIKYESNQGADYIKNTILTFAKSKNINLSLLNIKSEHSSTSKLDRAYPVSLLVNSDKIKIKRNQTALMKQLSNFTGFNTKINDDRVDAFCMAINYLTYELSLSNRTIENIPRF